MSNREIELQAKRAFAEEWLKNPSNPFAAALEICGNDPSVAMQIATSWVHDPEVKQLKTELISEYGEEYFLPSKASMVHQVLNRARNCPRDEDFVKLIKLAADMRGFIEKPGVTVNNTITTNKVMNIPVYVNQDGSKIDSREWEERLIEQQSQLIDR